MKSRTIEEQIGSGGIAFVNLDALQPGSPRIKLQFTGADRVRYLNGQVSNDVRKLQSAQGSSAQPVCVMNAKGKMNALAWLYSTDHALILNADGALSAEEAEDFRETLGMRLERYIIADDVEQSDISDDFVMLHLLGHEDALDSEAVRAILLQADREGSAWRRAARFACPGIDLIVPVAQQEEWVQRLAGVAVQIESASLEQFRIRQGVPRWGKELDENTLPAEAGLDTIAIDFHKGCYIGQEIISRIKSVGRVNRKLVRLTAPAPLEPGMELETEDGLPAGLITSAYYNDATDSSHALGYHRRGRPETGLSAAIPGTPPGSHRIPVELHPL